MSSVNPGMNTTINPNPLASSPTQVYANPPVGNLQPMQSSMTTSPAAGGMQTGTNVVPFAGPRNPLTTPTFEKPKPKETSAPMPDNSNKNILSKDVEIRGNIKFTNELIIDGKVEGEISSDGVLTVGENAEICGGIQTNRVVVLGKVTGNIQVTDRCELKARAHLEGDIVAGRLVIEEGATFIGKSQMVKPGSAAKTSAPTTAAEPTAHAAATTNAVAQKSTQPQQNNSQNRQQPQKVAAAA